jgi:hypothetical protein
VSLIGCSTGTSPAIELDLPFSKRNIEAFITADLPSDQ